MREKSQRNRITKQNFRKQRLLFIEKVDKINKETYELSESI